MGKIISLVLSIIYLIVAYISGGGEFFIIGLGFLVIPLFCIWFGDELGRYIGFAGRGYITKESPGVIVKFMGWVLLLLPAIIAIISFLIEGS